MHMADAFIQSDLHCIEDLHFLFNLLIFVLNLKTKSLGKVKNNYVIIIIIMHYIIFFYAFGRCFYPKQLTLH